MKKLVTFALLTCLVSLSALADVKISDLPAGTTLSGTEAVPAVQSAATVKTTPSAINTYVQAQTTSSTIIGKFSGSCSSSTFLRGDGACATAGGTFGADSLSTWNSSTADLSLGVQATPSVIQGKDGTVSSPVGADITVRSGHGFGSDSGSLFLSSGSGGGGAGVANPVWILGGTGTAHGAGGSVNITAGQTQVTGTGDSAGGSVNITAGNSDQGLPGNIVVTSGTNQTGSAGQIALKTNGTNRVVVTGTGQTTFSGSVIFSNQITYQANTPHIINQNTPATLSSSVNNYNFGSFGCCSGQLYRLEAASGGSTVTGFALSAGDFYMVYIFNVSGTDSITFKNESASSTAGNRFLTPNGADFILRPNSGVIFWYDNTGTSRWRVLSP